MNLYDRFVANLRVRRFTVLALIIFLLWLVRGVMSTLLLTFIFTFLMVHLIRWVQRKLPRIRPGVVVIPVYILIIGGIYIVISHYVPILLRQFFKLFHLVFEFYERPDVDSNEILRLVAQWIQRLNLNAQIRSSISQIFQYITNIGGAGVTFVVSFILSFFYSIEVDQLNRFGRLFIKSDFGWFFEDIYFFGQKFVNTFGVVLEAQLLIAIVNTTLTTITLSFMRMPSLAPLAVMVFFLSLIPVAGVMISLVPLSFVAYTVGGFRYIVYILIMIIVIHIIEAYILNPKFMSSRTQLPVFFTFVVLLASERLFGTWGLIVGIPIFTFFLDILGVKAIKGGTSGVSQRLHFHHFSRNSKGDNDAKFTDQNHESDK
ncbi:AI-2E family transporter [Agrilactobacillus fermenti]|uniref:AI-2E family transporter n=1 Tax=Agrilactobacillus fermenti TaxID=2586909 RepID=UPI001E408D51|nr:AI-2E family transporter [Agrilactobacillus fermenti]MCD2256609.1 AI-2E family transporter [Agrilactobacillus fermenti]